ncbi:hypothetical protein GCM10011390_41820 [Aureimonas endophytica]|uniref:NusG-like N-terminal domain-containing protein n=1 Tax=Aureimonas endophytica TaxID=2027858 RepID=A0A916ZY14_9HYPH|nr:transcription termination/antitermination NusG family protein [Aureimonas endophytica]GGE18290.1 hypothetical protein GCM10011390_41820 [Aureimonas endophytica]
MTSDQPSWYVVRTNPRCEERAAAGLHAAGFHVHLPRGVKLVRRRHMRTKQSVRFPLLTGYLFAGLSRDTPWFYDLRKVDGVAKILGREMTDDEGRQERYVRIRADVVDEFRTLELAGAFSEKDVDGEGEDVPHSFEPGDRVVVTKGRLSGIEFVFDDYFGRHAAKVVGQMLGSHRFIEVPLASLAKAA